MRVFFASLVALLLLSPAAWAKGPVSAEVCGVAGCRPVEGRATVESLMRGFATQRALLRKEGRSSAPNAAPFFTVRFTFGVPDENGRVIAEPFELTYVPSARAVRTTNEGKRPMWQRVRPRAARTYAGATRGLEPFPAWRFRAMGEPIRARADESACPGCPSGSEDKGARAHGRGHGDLRAYPGLGGGDHMLSSREPRDDVELAAHTAA